MQPVIPPPRVKSKEVLRLVSTHGGPFVTRRLLIVLLLVFVASILTPLGPVALKLVVDGFATAPTAQGLGVGLATALYVVSQWLSRSIDEVRGFIYARAERRIFTSLSERLFAHILRLPFSFHSHVATGGIQQIRENGLVGFQLIVHNLTFAVLPVVIQLLTSIWILLRIHQPMFLLIFSLTVVFFGAAFGHFVARVIATAEKGSAAQVESSALMNDCIANYETVKFFTAEQAVQARVHAKLTASERSWIEFYRNYAAIGLTSAAVFAIFLAIAIALAAREVHAARMTIGDFVLVNSLMLQLVHPIEILVYGVQDASRGVAMIGRMLALFVEKTEHEHPQHVTAHAAQAANERPLPDKGKPPARVEFRDVCVSYGSRRPILDHISFVVPAGKTLGIVGASGSGKTTLVRLLMRLLEPREGTILIDDAPASSRPIESVRRDVAVVSQDTALFNESIGYNIGFGRIGCSQNEIEHAAKLARLHDFICTLPDGYETPVGERGMKLSGGERQRVSIARAALKQPRLYVFDEATSSLDSTTEMKIMQNLREISRSRTTLIIAHRLSTVVHADQILVLERGAILERGNHAELLRRRGKYWELWLAQQTDAATRDQASIGDSSPVRS